MDGPDDAESVIELFRMNYERASKKYRPVPHQALST
jgi:hypothetical protein